jgi:hypothetical protein
MLSSENWGLHPEDFTVTTKKTDSKEKRKHIEKIAQPFVVTPHRSIGAMMLRFHAGTGSARHSKMQIAEGTEDRDDNLQTDEALTAWAISCVPSHVKRHSLQRCRHKTVRLVVSTSDLDNGI